MQRRRHAEELLEWRQRLDAEEAEVRRMEKQALAAWEKQQQPRIRTPLQQRSRESEHSKTSGGHESPTGQGEECENGKEVILEYVFITVTAVELYSECTTIQKF